MKYTKRKIKEIRKGIALGEVITQEQAHMLNYFAIPYLEYRNNFTREIAFYKVQCALDGVLRKLSYKR